MANLLVTGATGFTGSIFLRQMADSQPGMKMWCLVRPTSNLEILQNINLELTYLKGDSSRHETWFAILSEYQIETIVHIASIRHVPVILSACKQYQQTPRLIIVGTTGVYSKFNQYSATYKNIENQLIHEYPGCHCLLRPTMIYGSQRDKNLHKLICFCNQYGFFPVFGDGQNVLQPVHVDDLANAILNSVLSSNLQGAFDLSGGSIVSFNELIALVAKTLGKNLKAVYLPLTLGIWFATLLENVLRAYSPVRREQILRLQEDKAYSNQLAREALKFYPRSLENGLSEEIEILRQNRLI